MKRYIPTIRIIDSGVTTNSISISYNGNPITVCKYTLSENATKNEVVFYNYKPYLLKNGSNILYPISNADLELYYKILSANTVVNSLGNLTNSSILIDTEDGYNNGTSS